MRSRDIGRRAVLTGMAGTIGLATLFNLARWARAAESPADHEAVLYSSRSGEPVAIVVKPKNVQFAVKADFGMPTRALAPPEFERLGFGMGPESSSHPGGTWRPWRRR